jgi:hypothetical protein
MPLYNFVCCKCHQRQRRILTLEAAKQIQMCGKTLQDGKVCKYILKRSPVPPSTQTTEVIDNGIMTKRLERPADAERLYSERHEALKRQRGE